MGKFKRMLAALAAITMTLGSLSLSSYADDSKAETSSKEEVSVSDDAEEKGYILVVEGVQGNSALMNDGHILVHELYSKYSGNKNTLKSGDVIEMSGYAAQEIAGGLITFIEEDAHIKYLGNVSDVYKDSIKELTVTEKTDDTYFKLKDSEGTLYSWKSNVGEVRNLYKKSGVFECGIDPKDVNVGDVVSCAVEEKEYLVRNKPPIKKMEVVLPVSVVSKAADTKKSGTAVSAEGSIYVVTAEGDDYVLVNNDTKLPRWQYMNDLGKDKILKYGDVLDIDVEYVLDSYPGQLGIKDGTTIKYLGTVDEVYKDSIKELTVTKASNGFELKDKDGNIYHWNVNKNLSSWLGLSCNVEPISIIEGDVLKCAVSDADGNNRKVVLPLDIVTKLTRLTVVGVSKDYVLFSNGAALSNESFAIHSGTDRKLECGDVIETNVESFLETYPMQFEFSDDSYVKYIGTAEEVYKDSTADLTVTEIKDGVISLTDKNNNEYYWLTGLLTRVYSESLEKAYTYKSNIDVDSINVGDIIKCAYEMKSYNRENVVPVSVNDVVYPIRVESHAAVPPLDEQQGVYLKGDADLNGLVELADLVTVAKNVLSDSAFPLKNSVAYKNADMNDDDNVDSLDVSALIENQLGKDKKEPAPEPVNSSETVELTAKINRFSVQTSKPDSKFEDSQIDFAVSLLKNTMLKDRNTLVSPYSVSQALAMTANGAGNNTLKEMMNVIGGGMDITGFNKQMAGYKNSQPNDEDCRLLSANSIWYTNDTNKFVADESFLQTDKSYYDAQIFSAPLDNNTVKDVNSWVEKHTDGMIPSIIDKFEENSIMTLVNAVTFDAKWMSPYYDSYDRKNFFTAVDGTKQDAKIMGKLSYMPYLKDKEASGVLKYYADGRYAFAAILPNEDIPINDYVKGLTAEKLSSLLRSAKDEEVDFTLPKFKTEFDSSLVDQLKAMGVNDAFDVGTADFSKMGTSDLGGIFINDVIHKTFIDVNETGTRAAAATAVEMAAGDALIENYETVTLDRPFVYAIVDTQTNIPIFIGTLLTLK